MSNLPSFNELYEEYKAQVIADSTNRLRDFSPGSRLDAYAGVATTAAQSTMRYISHTIGSFFLFTAAGSDLEKIIRDRWPYASWLERKPGESDADLLSRVVKYLEVHSRGTLASLRYYVENVKSGVIENATVTENFSTGVIEIRGKWTQGVDQTIAEKVILEELEWWRPAGSNVHLSISSD